MKVYQVLTSQPSTTCYLPMLAIVEYRDFMIPLLKNLDNKESSFQFA